MRGNVRKMRRWLTILAMISSVGSAQSADAPRRVVSFNLCADQLVLALSDPAQVAGLSPYAADSSVSVMAEQAKKFPRLDWQAESVIPLKPDLVLTGPWDRPMTRRILNSLGYRSVEVDVVTDIDAARKQILEVAVLLGHPERGVKMVEELDAERRRMAAEHAQTGTALVLERGGFASGSHTIAAALLAEAGMRSPQGAPTIGGFLPLEKLLMLKPDFVVLKDPPREPTDQGALYLTHPALRGAYPPSRRIELPARYSMCGGPALIEAMRYLEGEFKRLR
jgi:iron complex transport system substrate-binding protein